MTRLKVGVVLFVGKLKCVKRDKNTAAKYVKKVRILI